MLAHQQKCHTKAKSPFLCKNSSIEKGEILKNETQGPTGPKDIYPGVSISVEKTKLGLLQVIR
jgi:hypothetical protein